MATDFMDIPDADDIATSVAKPNDNGREAAADSRPVALSTEDKAVLDAISAKLAASIAVTGTFWQATQPISAAALPLPSGAATSAKQDSLIALFPGSLARKAASASFAVVLSTEDKAAIDAITTAVGANTVGVGTAGAPNSNVLTIQGIGSMTPLLVTPGALVAGTAVIGKVGIDQTTDGTTNKVNIDASLKSGTATRSSVNSGVSSVTILASNANRKGATIINTDANALLLDLSGGTAAATRYQVKLLTDQTHEVAAGYTGAITGIWAADGTGIADVVEFT